MKTYLSAVLFFLFLAISCSKNGNNPTNKASVDTSGDIVAEELKSEINGVTHRSFAAK